MERTSENEKIQSLMYRNALLALSSGCLDPVSREILAFSPLPPDFTDPYCTEEVDAKQAMELAFSAMNIWIDEAKKVNYFSKRFVQLSRMVMNGVTTMGRGLVSMHARGEDPDTAPMPIDSLISLASYHFRKSYLGVLQTAKSRPEISERLLVNQLGWTNMILRLYKTKEKLAKPLPTARKAETDLPVSGTVPAVSGPEQAAPELPAGNIRAYSDPSPIPGQSAFTAPRAFSACRGNKLSGTACPHHAAATAQETDAIARTAEKREKTITAESKNPDPENDGNPVPENENDAVSAFANGCSAAGSSGLNKVCEDENKTGIADSGTTETGMPEEREAGQEDPEGVTLSAGKAEPEEEYASLPVPLSGDGGPDKEPGTPRYLEILKNIYGRSGPPDEGGFRMTYDEVAFLASDPEFSAIDPRSAERFRQILRKIDSG